MIPGHEQRRQEADDGDPADGGQGRDAEDVLVLGESVGQVHPEESGDQRPRSDHQWVE